ncbi:MAG TPA: flagellar basal body-associated FliL family protein [Burkholderiaceae bacterium]|nr:flagellar basal body-associated FliL family protein [Burkholderiaceae bacterium]
MSDKGSAANAAPAKKRRGLIVGLGAALLCAGAGAGAWVFTRPAEDELSDELPEHRPTKKSAPVYVPLDQFTVNLADEGGERLAQVGVTLELVDAKAEATAKAQMPAMRNSILLLLSSSLSTELLTVAGKHKLAARIAELTGQHLGWQQPPEAPPPAAGNEFVLARQTAQHRGRPNPVEAVHFSHFIVQ